MEDAHKLKPKLLNGATLEVDSAMAAGQWAAYDGDNIITRGTVNRGDEIKKVDGATKFVCAPDVAEVIRAHEREASRDPNSDPTAKDAQPDKGAPAAS